MQRNVELVRTVREAVGDEIDVMADAYMGWTLDYAKRMLPLLEPFHLRWLEEPVIPDDIHGYAELKALRPRPHRRRRARVHAATASASCSRRAPSTTSSSTPTASAASRRRARSRRWPRRTQVPVVPHAGQMHNYHVVMASLNSPMAEYFPIVDVEVGNELFWYIFDGEPKAEDGFVDLDDDVPGLGLTVNERALASSSTWWSEIMSKPRVALHRPGPDGLGHGPPPAGCGLSPHGLQPQLPSGRRRWRRRAPTCAASPREAAARADVVLSMVADDGASRDVWLGEHGALAGAARGTVLVESSTLTVGWIEELARRGRAPAASCSTRR